MLIGSQDVINFNVQDVTNFNVKWYFNSKSRQFYIVVSFNNISFTDFDIQTNVN